MSRVEGVRRQRTQTTPAGSSTTTVEALRRSRKPAITTRRQGHAERCSMDTHGARAHLGTIYADSLARSMPALRLQTALFRSSLFPALRSQVLPSRLATW